MFQHNDDHIWLAAGPLEVKLALWDAIFSDAAPNAGDASSEERWQLHTEAQLLEAMQVLAMRIGAMGLEPELTRVQPRIIEFESPFVHLGAEVLHFAEAWRARHADPTAEHEDELHMMVLFDQCSDVMVRARRTAASEGTSLSLTFLLVRIAAVDRWMRLTHDLVHGENRRNSLREPFGRLTGLLALRVTEHARLTGEHYIRQQGRLRLHPAACRPSRLAAPPARPAAYRPLRRLHWKKPGRPRRRYPARHHARNPGAHRRHAGLAAGSAARHPVLG